MEKQIPMLFKADSTHIRINISMHIHIKIFQLYKLLNSDSDLRKDLRLHCFSFILRFEFSLIFGFIFLNSYLY